MANALTDSQRERLRSWFSAAAPDGPLSLRDIQCFLDAAAVAHFMPRIASEGRAQQVFCSVHHSLPMQLLPGRMTVQLLPGRLPV